MNDTAPSAANPRSDAASFRVHAVRDVAGASDRVVWCVSRAGRELGRFPNAESALRAAMTYAREALQKGEAPAAIVSRERVDGPDIIIQLAAFR